MSREREELATPLRLARMDDCATMLARMVAGARDQPNSDGGRPLVDLNLRDETFAASMMRAWSLVGDVLAFYQARFADEGYVATCCHDDEAHLGRLVGRPPSPRPAAKTQLVFTAALNTGLNFPITVPKGTPIRAIEGPDGDTQIFETSEEIEVHAEGNGMAIVPETELVGSKPVAGEAGRFETTLRGTALGLGAGDPLWVDGGLASVVSAVESASEGTTRLRFASDKAPSGSAGFFRLGAPEALHGAEAPDWGSLALTTRLRYCAIRDGAEWKGGAWSRLSTDALPATEAVIKATNSFAGALIAAKAGSGGAWSAVGGGAIPGAVTAIHASEGRLFAGTEAGEVYRSTDGGAHWEPAPGGVLVTKVVTKPSDGTNPETSTWTTRVMDLPAAAVDRLLWLEGVLYAEVRGVVYGNALEGAGWISTPAPETADEKAERERRETESEKKAREKRQAAKGLMTDLAGTLGTLSQGSQTAAGPDEDVWVFYGDGVRTVAVAFEGARGGDWPAEELPVAAWGPERATLFLSRPVLTIKPGGSVVVGDRGGATRLPVDRHRVEVRQAMMQAPGSVSELSVGLPSPAPARPSYRDTLVYPVLGPLDPAPVSSPVTPPACGSVTVPRGFSRPLTKVAALVVGKGPDDEDVSETVVIASAERLPDGSSKLLFESPLAHRYQSQTVRIHLNSVEATQGMTVRETLGDGDPATPFQSFALAQGPLAYLAGVQGAPQTTLRVEVNGSVWTEAPSFAKSGPYSSHYVVRLDASQHATVVFGDGEKGARLPRGLGNVVATYRVGDPAKPAPKAGNIAFWDSRPLGLQDVENPLDAEYPPSEQPLAPLVSPSSSGSERAVTAEDVGTMAAALPGVAAASSFVTGQGAGRAVRLLVALDDGLDPSGWDTRLGEYFRGRKGFAAPIEIRVNEPQPIRFEARVPVDPQMAETLKAGMKAALEARFGRGKILPKALAKPDQLTRDILGAIQDQSGVLGVRFDEPPRFVAGGIAYLDRLTADLLEPDPGRPSPPGQSVLRLSAL